MLAEPADKPDPAEFGASCEAAAPGGQGLTDDDGVVVGDQHLAVDVDQLSDQRPLQVGVRPQAGERDEVHPLVPHCKHDRPESRQNRQVRQNRSQTFVQQNISFYFNYFKTVKSFLRS